MLHIASVQRALEIVQPSPLSPGLQKRKLELRDGRKLAQDHTADLERLLAWSLGSQSLKGDPKLHYLLV